MRNFINKFRMPTLLGLGVIIIGLVSGVYLVLKDQIFTSQAAPSLTPQNLTLSNMTENSIVISWQTGSATSSFITYGLNNPNEQTILDDRDNNSSTGPKSYLTHYFTLKNLLPKTTYQFKIVSGKNASDMKKFQTTAPFTTKTSFSPVIGSILNENLPLDEGLIYLSIGEATVQSALIKKGGNFLIPLSSISKADLTDIYQLTEGEIAKITVHSDKGEASALFKLKSNLEPLPPIKLGQNIDLTTPEETPLPTPTPKQFSKYDLNNDGIINSADYAIVSTCLGKKPATILAGNISCSKADLNGDGVIDRKDLELMSNKIRQLQGTQ